MTGMVETSLNETTHSSPSMPAVSTLTTPTPKSEPEQSTDAEEGPQKGRARAFGKGIVIGLVTGLFAFIFLFFLESLNVHRRHRKWLALGIVLSNLITIPVCAVILVLIFRLFDSSDIQVDAT